MMRSSAAAGPSYVAQRRSTASHARPLSAMTKARLAMQLWVLCATVAVVDALHTGAFESTQYRRLGRVAPERVVPLAIALKPRDFRALEDQLWRVSDPRSMDYGKHLTRDEADDLGRPDERALQALHEWVGPHAEDGSVEFSTASNTLTMQIRARKLDSLLGTQLHEYERVAVHTEPRRDGHRLLRASVPISVPDHLDSAIAYVSINTHPLQLRSLAASAPTAVEGVTGGTLEKIRKLYGIPDDLVVTNASNSQCVPSFYHESWSPDDLKKFFDAYLKGDPLPHIVEKGDRENIPEKASIEAALDVEYITGVARNTTTYVWTMNGSNPYSVQDEPFVAFVEAILKEENPPLVVSISYSDDEEHMFKIAPDYARSFDALLIKMGLRGITVLIASGDDGVVGLRPEFNDVPRDEACNKNGPQWPTASPYITAVGATMTLSQGQAEQSYFDTNEEVVCSGEVGGMITTGGGFSSIYPMPEYQRRAVTKYLKTKRVPTLQGFFNSSGRAYPDLTALGAGFAVYLHGRTTSVSGTSASTPVVGAMVTLWNDIRLNAGKAPLGFINPLIYYLAEHEPDAFNDIVVGNNAGSKGNTRSCAQSFGAAPGWDAVSGVGSPNFAFIASFVRNLGEAFNASALTNTTPPPLPPCEPKGTETPESTGVSASGEKSDGFSTLGVTLLVGSVVVVAMLGAVFAVRMYKHWRRTQYASLNVDTANATQEETNNITPPGSPPSPRGSISGMRQSDEGGDLDKLESDGIEMSEINLHD